MRKPLVSSPLARALVAVALAIVLASLTALGLSACSPSSVGGVAGADTSSEATAQATTAASATTAETTEIPQTVSQPVTTPVYTFYFVRHGQTLFNVKNLAQGWCDSPLTETGVAQARAAGRGLAAAGVIFDAAYASDLGRCRDTAAYVLEGTGLSAVPTFNLREVSFGSGEGDVGGAPGGGIDRSVIGWSDLGGETWAQVIARMDAAVATAMAEHPEGGAILMVSHGMSIDGYVRAHFSNSDVYANSKGGVGNCSVTIVSVTNGEATLVSYADSSYRDAGL